MLKYITLLFQLSLKNDPDTVKIQAAIIYDVIRGETTLAEAKNRINVYLLKV